MLAETGADRAQRTIRSTLALVVLFLLLVARLCYLQIGQHDIYKRAADENRIRALARPAPRGIIRDRAGHILAENRAIYNVEVIAGISAARADTLAALFAATGSATREELRDRLQAAIPERPSRIGRHLRRPVTLIRDARIPLVAFVEERAATFPDLHVRTRAKRYYRYQNAACHAIGYLGEIREKELAKPRNRSRYNAGDLIGRAGIEQQYEDLLRGEAGTRVVEVDARGREIRVLSGGENVDPVPGMNLFLTLDIELEELADSLLSDKSGAVVALDPRNGDVLVLASKPDYDLNVFGRGRISSSDWAAIRDDPGTPMLHRAIAGLYPPASTWKLAVSALGLESGYITPSSEFPAACGGGYRFGKRYFRCWLSSGHGTTNLLRAFETSCDVYYYQLGQRFQLDAFMDGARSFGFGSRTGIDLPGEKSGQLPSSEWYNKQYGSRGWSRGVLLNLAIGQGEVLATPLQMAAFYGAVANHGALIRPHLLLRATAAENDDAPPVVATPQSLRLPLSDATLATLETILARVVEERHGTGKAAAVPGVRVGGKTGTAQNPHGENHAWFVGVAPLGAPEIAVATIIEGGGHGSSAAAPIVGAILRRHFSGRAPLPPLAASTPKPHASRP
jgi:penicillin-binding protein 2